MIAALTGMLDDLALVTRGLRTSTVTALPSTADDVASRIDDVAFQLDRLPNSSEFLYDDGIRLAQTTREAGHDVRLALDSGAMDPLDRALRGIPTLDDATTGVRSIADDVDGYIDRARTQVDGARYLVDDVEIAPAWSDDVATSHPWEPTPDPYRIDDGFSQEIAVADDWLTPSTGGFDDAFDVSWMG